MSEREREARRKNKRQGLGGRERGGERERETQRWERD